MTIRSNPIPLSRRYFMAISTTIAVASASVVPLRESLGAGPLIYDGLKTDDYLGPVETLATLDGEGAVTEGPAIDRAGNVFFTHMPKEQILKWSPQTKQVTLFRERSNRTNGLYFTPEGDLLCCETRSRRVTRTNMTTGEIKVIADSYQGRPLAQPNDICMDNQGRIFFSSRSDPVDPEGENPKGVYRIDRDGKLTRVLVWPDVHMPNGLAFTPDYKQLVLIDAHPDENHHRDIRVYNANQDGSLTNGRVLINLYPGRSGDGMAVDGQGNLYIAAGLNKTRQTSETLDTRPGIHVFSPDGRLLAYRSTPVDLLTNCKFGGPDMRSLYVSCGNLLLHIRTTKSGINKFQ